MGVELTVRARTDFVNVTEKEMKKVSDKPNKGRQWNVLLHWVALDQTRLPERCGLVE